MSQKHLDILFKVAGSYEGDSVAVSLINDIFDRSVKYIQTVVAHESARRLYANTEYEQRKYINDLDQMRHTAHDALIAAVAATNRLCASKSLDPIFPGDIEDRAAVGDFALQIVNDLFVLRAK